MTTNHLNADEADSLLDSQENHFRDFKDTRISPAKLTHSVSAFANSDGGELYIGISQVEQRFVWAGFETIEDANGHLQIFEKLFPLGQFFRYEFLTADRGLGNVLFVQILKTPNILKASDSIAYLRRGAQNIPQTSPEELRRLELNKGIASFESDTVNVSPSELYASEITKTFVSHVIPKAQAESWLRKQQLVRGRTLRLAACCSLPMFRRRFFLSAAP